MPARRMTAASTGSAKRVLACREDVPIHTAPSVGEKRPPITLPPQQAAHSTRRTSAPTDPAATLLRPIYFSRRLRDAKSHIYSGGTVRRPWHKCSSIWTCRLVSSGTPLGSKSFAGQTLKLRHLRERSWQAALRVVCERQTMQRVEPGSPAVATRALLGLLPVHVLGTA